MENGSFAIPLRRKGRGQARLQDTDVYVEAIEVGTDQRPTARVKVVPFRDSRKPVTVEVRAGDVLTIGEAQHRVRSVMPRKQSQPSLPKKEGWSVPGWVELNPSPVKD